MIWLRIKNGPTSAFTEQMPDLLTLLCGRAACGLWPDPGAGDAGRANVAAHVGGARACERSVGLGSPCSGTRGHGPARRTDDLDLVVTAITVQYDWWQPGADAGRHRETVRDRIRMMREIRVLTASSG